MKKTGYLFTLLIILISAIIFSCGGGGGTSNAMEDNSFSISYNANGAESGTVPATQSGKGSQKVSISGNTGNLAKNGYLFDGWENNGSIWQPGDSLSGNITLFARWVPIFDYEIINLGSPAPILDGIQKISAISCIQIIGLTQWGHQFSSLNIPDSIDGYTVTGIGDYAFYSCGNLYNVTIPNTVTNIGDNAFAECSNLVDMTLLGTEPPDIGTGALYNCPVIISVPSVDSYKGSVGWNTYSTSITYIGADIHKLIYNGNGSDGGTVPRPQVDTNGFGTQVSGNTGNLTRAGCTFESWNTKPDGSGFRYNAGESIAIINEPTLTLYAQWTHPDYIVTFNGNGSNGQAFPGIITVRAPDNTIKELPVPPTAPVGYYFGGWNTKADGTGTQFVVGSSVINNMTVYAKWLEGPFSISYNPNGADSGTVPASQKGITNTSVTIIDNTGNLHKTGHIFIGWNTRSDGLGNHYAPGSLYAGPGDIVLYACWKQIFTVMVNSTSGGSAAASSTSNIFAGTIITLTVSPNNLYEMDTIVVKDTNDNNVSINTQIAGSKYTFTMPQKNVVVTVSFRTCNGIFVDDINDLTVGDVVLGNGRYVTYANFNIHSIDYTAISIPVGVVAYKGSTGNYGTTGKVYMVGLNQKSSFKWAPDGTKGYNTQFNTSNTTGEDNWEVIVAADPSGSASANNNYPAFDYANKYSAGNYTNGWFMPSMAELEQIYENKAIINNSLNAIIRGGSVSTLLPDNGYFWSSSQSQYNCYSVCTVNFNFNNMSISNKNNVNLVRVVRVLNY